MLAVQGAVGFFGYELIHRMQAVLTVVLFMTFLVFAVKLVAGHQIVTPATVQGADLAGAFVLEVTIAFSLAVSWASYAADFSRYLPADSSRARVFGFTFAGIVLAYIFVQGIGDRGGRRGYREQTAEGVRSVMGGGLLGGLALLSSRLASIGSGCDERLQRVAGAADDRGQSAAAGVGRDRRRPWRSAHPVAARRRHRDPISGCAAARELLDSRRSSRSSSSIGCCASVAGRASTRPRNRPTGRDAVAAVIVFLLAYAAAIPFMNTSLIEGPIAQAWHGADIAYFVNLVVAAVLYGGYRVVRERASHPSAEKWCR